MIYYNTPGSSKDKVPDGFTSQRDFFVVKAKYTGPFRCSVNGCTSEHSSLKSLHGGHVTLANGQAALTLQCEVHNNPQDPKNSKGFVARPGAVFLILDSLKVITNSSNAVSPAITDQQIALNLVNAREKIKMFLKIAQQKRGLS